MDAAAELGRNPVSKHQIQPEYGDEQADAGRGCRTRLVSPNSQARTETGSKNKHFPCSADHEQDWQPYPVDRCSAISYNHKYMHSACVSFILFVLFPFRVSRNRAIGTTSQRNGTTPSYVVVETYIIYYSSA